jgi:very-short-patch-repair endonuclease
VVIYKGLTFVVEVDGDTYHNESPSDADKRLVPLTYEGVEVRRVPAKDLATDEAADQVVANLVKFMASRKASR